MTVQEKSSFASKIKNVIVFRYLSEEALADLIAVSTIERHADGDRIVSEGEMDDHLFGVLEGSVNVFVRERDKPDREVFICALGEGEVFGESGIFLRTPRTANVLTGDATVILKVGRDDLFALIQRHPTGGMKILYVMIYGLLKKLREANQEIAFERKSVLRQEDIDSVVDAAIRKM